MLYTYYILYSSPRAIVVICSHVIAAGDRHYNNIIILVPVECKFCVARLNNISAKKSIYMANSSWGGWVVWLDGLSRSEVCDGNPLG